MFHWDLPVFSVQAGLVSQKSFTFGFILVKLIIMDFFLISKNLMYFETIDAYRNKKSWGGKYFCCFESKAQACVSGTDIQVLNRTVDQRHSFRGISILWRSMKKLPLMLINTGQQGCSQLKLVRIVFHDCRILQSSTSVFYLKACVYFH